MVLVEKVRGGSVYLRALDQSFEIGDRADVSEGLAEHLVESRGDFEPVDDVTDVEYEEVDGEDDDAPREEDGPPDENDEMGERAAALREESWQTAVSTVQDGEADAYLDELEQIDDRDSVQEAIENRRDELEG